MKTGLKFAALSVGLAVALGGAASASAGSHWNAHPDQRGRSESRLDHHPHRFAVERRHHHHEEARFGRHGVR